MPHPLVTIYFIALLLHGISAFLVSKSTPGLILEKKEDKLGIHATSTCNHIFHSFIIARYQCLSSIKANTRVISMGESFQDYS